MTNTELITVEFHCHTGYSLDCLVKVESLLKACRQKGIDRLAITDHNTMQGAFRAYELDPDRVILAEEVLTTEGEILGYFMSEEIPRGLKPMEVIERLKKQNALISLPHPFDPARGKSWKQGTIMQLLPHIDAIEVFNSRCVNNNSNKVAQQFAQTHDLNGMVGSDAHSLFELGRSVMVLPKFDNADELRQALGQAQTKTKLTGSYIHLLSRYAKFHNSFIKAQ